MLKRIMVICCISGLWFSAPLTFAAQQESTPTSAVSKFDNFVWSNRLVKYSFIDLRVADFALAEEKLNEALVLNPKNAYAYNNLGYVYENTGRKEEAAKMYRKVIELNPTRWVVNASDPNLKGMSIVSIATTNLACLEQDCVGTHVDPPTVDQRLASEGFFALQKGDNSEAEKKLTEALAINPNNPYAILNMGVIYERSGRKEEAKVMYQKVIDMNAKIIPMYVGDEKLAGKSLKQIAKSNIDGLNNTAVNYTPAK